MIMSLWPRLWPTLYIKLHSLEATRLKYVVTSVRKNYVVCWTFLYLLGLYQSFINEHNIRDEQTDYCRQCYPINCLAAACAVAEV